MAMFKAEMAENPVTLTPIEDFDTKMLAMSMAKIAIIADAAEYARVVADLDPSERNDEVDFPRFVEMKDRENFRPSKIHD